MTTEVRIRNLHLADDTGLRSQEVNISGQWIRTPVKCLEPKPLFRETRITAEPTLVELYRTFKEDSLNRFLMDKRYEVSIARTCGNQRKRVGADKPTLTILKYVEPHYPSEAGMRALTRASWAFSDIVPVPAVPKCARGVTMSNAGQFFDYVERALGLLQMSNNKPIMGYVPILNQLHIEQLVEYYLSQGINSYYLDFDGTTLTVQAVSIRTIKETLARQGYEEDHFLHFVNARYGTNATGSTNVIPAKDIIGFGLGLDSFGGMHVPPRRPPEYYEWLRSQRPIEQQGIRVFDKEGYGYHRAFTSDLDRVRRFYPTDSSIPFDSIDFGIRSRVNRSIKIVNCEQQQIEANRLSTFIHEEPENTLRYYQGKEFLERKTIDTIRTSR